MTGTIKTLNTQKGFGFILATDGREYFFHHSAVKNARFDAMRQGDEVTFDDTEGKQGPRAERVYAA